MTPYSNKIYDAITVITVFIAVFTILNYAPDAMQDRTAQLVQELNILSARIERMKLELRNTSCLGDYEDLLQQIDDAPGHAILLKERGEEKLKIWAVATHNAPEYFTSNFDAFKSKRYMSSACAVYVPVQNDGVYTSKWCQ